MEEQDKTVRPYRWGKVIMTLSVSIAIGLGWMGEWKICDSSYNKHKFRGVATHYDSYKTLLY